MSEEKRSAPKERPAQRSAPNDPKPPTQRSAPNGPKAPTLKTARRYLGLKGVAVTEMEALLERAYATMLEAAAPKHSLVRCPVRAEGAAEPEGHILHFGDLPPVESADLCRLFEDCREGYALVGTLGMGVDMAIRRLTVTDPALAAAVAACGSAYIDVYIDEVVQAEARTLPPGLHFTPRFSPGYGDAPLTMQGPLLGLLGGGRLGVRLTEASMMLPEKTVTALWGITAIPARACRSHCDTCTKIDCAFREEA